MATLPLLSKIHTLVSGLNNRDTRAINGRANYEHEQRKEFRRGSNERLFLQVVQSDDQDMVGTTISCMALNMSPNGLMVACDQRIPEGCFIDLWVDDSARPGKFFLSSQVCWETENEPGEFQIGVALLDGAATDIEEWRARQAS